jgi:hypothetical protein
MLSTQGHQRDPLSQKNHPRDPLSQTDHYATNCIYCLTSSVGFQEPPDVPPLPVVSSGGSCGILAQLEQAIDRRWDPRVSLGIDWVTLAIEAGVRL